MGFLSGSVTFERYRITNDPTGQFGDEHIEILQKNKIDSSGANLAESPCFGFSGGSHLLDTQFEIGKNIIGDAMHFGVRVDSIQIPGPIKQAWMQIELGGALKDSPGKRPTKSQREDAQQAVEARCAAEAAKGNYQRMGVTPVLWDAQTETVYLGSSSEKANETCLSLLKSSFGLEFSHVTSGSLALEFAEANDQTKAIFGASPSSFHPMGGANVVWWNGMTDNYDYLGNEFLLWLWWHWEKNSNVVSLSDGSEVSGMFARSLSLDCPMGEHGKESISSESPVALPEAMMAIRMGKLPRKAGLTLVRDGEQFDLTLKAETFSIGAARISQVGDDVPTRELLDRIESIRQLSETSDLLFEVFCQTRLGKSWPGEMKKMLKWLREETPMRMQQKAA
ncbi:MAG: hypothetical protein P8J27_13115 [Mariniblastus sp.]|nr:hypothetical protein [Mariniblastus sp.]